MTKWFSLAFACLFACSSARAAEDALTSQANEFFEKKIRPVLVEHCYQCHSQEAVQAKKLKGGILLDSREGFLKGGDTGPAIIPGKPEQGTLMQALRYSNDLQMPPKGKLPETVIADFEQWITMGAPDPRTSTPAAKSGGINIDAGRNFWSFQMPKKSPPPNIVDSAWIKTEIDPFIRAKMEEKGLSPSPRANKRTLIRRAYFDLLGLPPTWEEVEAFVKDERPQAYVELIERLLQSPHYGERYARHWLDVARYAEDQAHTFGVRKKDKAFQYRDWVIKALNDDMPYDRFVRLQIAGDMVDPSEGDLFTRLAGLGFLGLGAEYYKNTAKEQAIAEELDDRVDTLTRGFLGLTVACARCHDHKYDPIPTRDYYSLAGLFYGSNLSDAPLVSPEEVKRYNEGQQRIKEMEDRIKAWLGERSKEVGLSQVGNLEAYLNGVFTFRTGKGSLDEIAKKQRLNRTFLDRWVKALDPASKPKPAVVFKEIVAALPQKGKPGDEKTFQAAVAKFLKPAQAAIAAEVAVNKAYQEALAKASDPKSVKRGSVAKEHESLLKAIFTDTNAPFLIPSTEIEKSMKPEAKAELERMRNELSMRQKSAPPMYPVAHVIQGGGQTMQVYIRGNPAKKGEWAPKGFLQVLSKPDAYANITDPQKHPYSRLDLANAIASRDNPLTARVIVNRVWQWHFGRGLVSTASNYGKLGDRPTHPELLDTLAVRFMENGWSMKWLHRQIMLSATYQQASEHSAAGTEKDPANLYLARMARHRQDIESWRDSLLVVAGTLDPTRGGPTYDLKDPNARRRTVYAKISRHELDGLLRLFDFPDANVTASRRTETTVPQQQLFVLNSEFMINQARAFAVRLEKAATPEAKVRLAYQLAYQRNPTDPEIRLGVAFLKQEKHPADKLTVLQQYAQILLASNEFMYVD